MIADRHPSSYRDPSGFLYFHNQVLYRQVNLSFKNDFDLLLSSGLYNFLVENNLLVPHLQRNENFRNDEQWLTTLEPELLPFISYPSEWCFDMLKDAALLTLSIAEAAMEHGMMLKDASAYNMQFYKGRMMLVDSLSFEKYNPTRPWIAYRQFCEHFLAPLAVMHYMKFPLQDLWKAYPEGFPLQLVKKMLPFKSKFNLHVYLHLHLHAGMAAKITPGNRTNHHSFSEAKLKNLFRSLRSAVESFHLKDPSGVWSGYYDEAGQRDDYVERKKEIIREWLKELNAGTVFDAGANEGSFSKIASSLQMFTIAADLDHFSINNLYNHAKKEKLENIYPLVMNLAAPTPATGLNNNERSSFLSRINSDVVMALALIHHLSIGNNIPFELSAPMFASMGTYLVIEFVPKTDPKVAFMLQQKKDVFDEYSEVNFLSAFRRYYSVIKSTPVGKSSRTMFLMKKNG